MVGIESIERKRQGIRLVKLEGIIRLWSTVYADDFEACSMIAHRGATGTTKQV